MLQKNIFIIILLVLFQMLSVSLVHATRIKDLASIEGVRDNQLLGYGLVIGLNGTGDDLKKSVFTRQSMVNLVKRLGMAITPEVFRQMKTDNVASVMVTAELPPFARPGSRLDILVSAIGDASSLSGGTLLMTPLKGADGKTYAVAQGPLALGSIAFGGKAAKVQKNFPTAGRISGGAIVERAVGWQLPPSGDLLFNLKNPDFTTANRMVTAINDKFGTRVAHSLDSGSIKVLMPLDYKGNVVGFVADLENITVVAAASARVVVNERTGTIVMGQDVRIATVAVSHGNLNLIIRETAEVVRPLPFAGDEMEVIPATEIEVIEEEGHLVVMEMGVSISEIARALNAIGATPRDLIAIFQAIKAAGALHAELIII
jgi:flagellar P-ring protein precursor FlgI